MHLQFSCCSIQINVDGAGSTDSGLMSQQQHHIYVFFRFFFYQSNHNPNLYLKSPTNLYEWVCLELALSKMGQPDGSHVSSSILTLLKQPKNSNRNRTISTGQLGVKYLFDTGPDHHHHQSSPSASSKTCSHSSLNSIFGTCHSLSKTRSSNLDLDLYELPFVDMIKQAIQDFKILKFGTDVSNLIDKCSNDLFGSDRHGLDYLRKYVIIIVYLFF